MKPGLVGKKKTENEENEKREKGFNIYLGGANNERITDQQKRDKLEKVRNHSSQSRERKGWNQPKANEPKIDTEDKNAPHSVSNTNITFANVERKKWGHTEKEPEPNNLDNSFEDLEIENKINREKKKMNEEDDDVDIVNCLDSLNKEDLLILRQSIKEGGLSKYLQQEKDRLDYQEDLLGKEDDEGEEDETKDDENELSSEQKDYEKEEEDEDYRDDFENNSENDDEVEDTIGNEINDELGGRENIDEEIPENIEFQTLNQPLNNDREKPQNKYGYGRETNYQPSVEQNKQVAKSRPISALASNNTYQTKSNPAAKNISLGGQETYLANIRYDPQGSKSTWNNPFKKKQSADKIKIDSKAAQQKAEATPSSIKNAQNPKASSTNLKKNTPGSSSSSSISKKKTHAKGLNKLISKIEKLDPIKKTQLEKIIDKIDNGELSTMSLLKLDDILKAERESEVYKSKEKIDFSPSENITSASQKKIFEEKKPSNRKSFAPEPKRVPEEPITSNKSEKSTEKTAVSEPIAFNMDKNFKDQQSVVIRVISTWGNAHLAGLTEVHIFDENGTKILLIPGNFSIINCPYANKKNIANLINGVTNTVEEKNMWCANMPAPPECLEIWICFKSSKKIGGMRIWNYNKGLIESVKGIKECEILINGKLMWSGHLKKGSGGELDDYSTRVPLLENFRFDSNDEDNRVVPVQLLKHLNPSKEGENKTKDNKVRPTSVPWLDDPNKFRNRFSEYNPDLKKPTEKIEPENKPSDNQAQGGVRESQTKKPGSSSKNHPKTIVNIFDEIDSKAKAPNERKKVENEQKSAVTHDQKAIVNHEQKSANNASEKIIVDHDKMRGGSIRPVNENNLFDSDPNGLEMLKYFNLTNEGRIRPAKRDSYMQAKAIDLQKDVKERLRTVQERISGTNLKVEESSLMHEVLGINEEQGSGKSAGGDFDALDVFFQQQQDTKKKNKMPDVFSVTDKKVQGGIVNQPGNPISFPSASKTMIDKPITKREKEITKDLIAQTTIPSVEVKPKIQSAGRTEPAGIVNPSSGGEQKFSIPTLPVGSQVRINILKTWGDKHYVGMSGIEFFDINGNPLKLKSVKEQIKADPPDINILEGYGKDPRTVDKLMDGVYLTCDDLHEWLAPFTESKDHLINIDFREKFSFAMIRIWNYNKSRIHSYRGAKLIEIHIDDKLVFAGEIKKAQGTLKGAERHCEYIMFTEDEGVIKKIEKNDWMNSFNFSDLEDKIDNLEVSMLLERPKTASRRFDPSEIRQIGKLKEVGVTEMGPNDRPFTSAKMEERHSISKEKMQVIVENRCQPSTGIRCSTVVIKLLETWGDLNYCGLSGLEIYDSNYKKIAIDMSNLNAKPRDINAVSGNNFDKRTLDKLINGSNITTDDNNMWLIPFAFGQEHYITIKFKEETTIKGIKFWNYNKNNDDTTRGVKLISVIADGTFITPTKGILIKKAPGNAVFDFGHYISLPFVDGWDEGQIKCLNFHKGKLPENKLVQSYIMPQIPTGFILKMVLLSTWGDLHYIGLNGIEIFDHNGDPIVQKKICKFEVSAVPSSIAELEGNENDVRTIDKLVNCVNDTYDDRSIWLAPIMRKFGQRDIDQALVYNSVFVVFDKPVMISAINYWNYTKNPERGVREIELSFDDKIIYKGYLRKATSKLEKTGPNDMMTTIVFTRQNELISKIDPKIYNEDGQSQLVSLYNEKRLMNPEQSQEQKKSEVKPVVERPRTSAKGN